MSVGVGTAFSSSIDILPTIAPKAHRRLEGWTPMKGTSSILSHAMKIWVTAFLIDVAYIESVLSATLLLILKSTSAITILVLEMTSSATIPWTTLTTSRIRTFHFICIGICLSKDSMSHCQTVHLFFIKIFLRHNWGKNYPLKRL